MTNQEAFDTVARHLAKQGKRSANADGICLYRAPDGSRCAVGALLPDALYEPRMEEVDVFCVLSEFSGARDYFENVSVQLMRHLQLAHDDKFLWDRNRRGLTTCMRAKLRFIAGIHSLSPTVLDTLPVIDDV